MLKHTPQPDALQSQSPAPGGAAQARVTPEELAAAVARLEARRAGGDGKIAIGEAVRELSLDATPEEILAEVQAGRGHARTVKPRWLSLRQRLGIYVAAGAVALGLTAVMATVTAPVPYQETQAVAAPVPAPPAHIQVAPNLLVDDASGKLVLLSEVGDDQPVHCGYIGGTFQPYSSGPSNAWTLIKHGGRVYVRGWMPAMSPAVLATDGADVTANGGPSFTPLTLAVDAFTVSSSSSLSNSPDAFHALSVRLDGHAYEKWNP